jgi:hypothetical protein
VRARNVLLESSAISFLYHFQAGDLGARSTVLVGCAASAILSERSDGRTSLFRSWGLPWMTTSRDASTPRWTVRSAEICG